MATRIRTLDFLPEIFKTPTNSQFLQATLDQLVAQPNTKKIEGYVGSKIGYGVNANDYYVTEPTKVRTDYQLDPAVVFLKENDTTAQDFISYPGIIDALKLEGGLTADNNRLFTSQFYSWDSFTDLDKIINFNQYYWLPEGPERVIISADIIYNSSSYLVTSYPNEYLISSESLTTPASNPTLTLLRGGTYTFAVSQASQFWIQGSPGVTGFSPTQNNVQTRDVYGVVNNGASVGVVTFNVPEKNALDEYNFPGNNTVGVVSDLPFSEVNGALVSTIGGIDGVTALDGLTVMFYNTGIATEYGYVNQFFSQTTFDQNGGVPYDPVVDYPGTDIFDNNFEGGYYTEVNANFYTVTLIGDPTNPQIQLTPTGPIPTNQKITPIYGTEWVNKNFYRSTAGSVALVPYNSAILNTLYYQDGTSPNKVGVIKLVDSNVTNTLDVETQILGKAQYTAPNGVVFTNGLKVLFQGDIYPATYSNQEYYVEGVGTAIELILVNTLVSPGQFAEGSYIPYDTTAYDVGNYDSSLYIPIQPDYITIARNAINKNAWSRGNRWFHIDVITATAEYNNTPAIVTQLATLANKAKRPIIEFYPNLRLFDSGVIGKAPVDFIDTRTTDAFSLVAGKADYYPDVAGYTGYNATIAPVTGPTTTITATETIGLVNQIILSSTTGLYVNDTITFGSVLFGGIQAGITYFITDIIDSRIMISTSKQGTPLVLTSATGTMTTSIYPYSTQVTVPTTSVSGLFEVGQYIIDSTNVLPLVSFITAITTVGANTIITVSWYNQEIIAATSVASMVTADTPLSNYSLFDGSRIVFAADTDLNVRNKIYVSRFSAITGSTTPVITLTEAPDGTVLADEQTAIYRGYTNKGKDFYFDGAQWLAGQQKTTINQPPKFDIFDHNGISFGNPDYYLGTSFTGSTLFSYGIGTGANDTVLGFPVRYSSVDNVGDLSFDVTLNTQTFDYVTGTNPITQLINTGYVYNYTSRTNLVRQLGWQTAVSPSIQYQVFEFDWTIVSPTVNFTCDIAPVSATSTKWPVTQVYINNQYLDPQHYTITTTDTTTTVSIPTIDAVSTVVQIFILSDQVSATGYYQTPINLNNNPFNENIAVANVGDIRGQYQSIFYNNPDTTGEIFGSNNYRDLGNLVPWGNRIIQNSASLVMPGTFLRKQNHNLFNSLMYNSRQYITFKNLLVDTVNSTDYNIYLSPATMLDDALDQINAAHTDSDPFFWSDMLPSKAPYISNTYSFANALDVSIYPLSKVYNFATSNYYGVLVYLTRGGVITQLVSGVDYTVSTDAPSLTVSLDLLPNDTITVNEYNQTYGSFVPNTPTKLGLYPATIPAVTLDTAYYQPTYFIVGHDGSYNKLYGDYNTTTNKLVDFRDQVLLEYETRVYNNLKLSNVIPVQAYEVIPGFFRDTDYSYSEFLEIYSESFLNWVGQNRINYKTQLYNKSNQYTYNYDNSGNKIDKAAIEQGYFRGLYLYYYDTSTPNETPWQMLGFANQPTWWTARYGAAPYTSDNLVLWGDLAAGINWNNGTPFVMPKYVRPQLLKVLPVDSAGNLVSPFVSIVGNYTDTTFARDWKVGDVGPAEFSYRRSSSWPFDLMRILALTKPAQFFNLAADVDNYKYNFEFNQYLVNDRSHLTLGDIPIYGLGTPANSYINWIVDFEKQVGVDATTNITTLLDNLDVRLVYRLAGFSDKSLLKFYVEKSSANSNNSSLLIPDESFAVLLYDNQPFDRIIYTGVVVQITENGYKVYGNSQTNAYFKALVPKNNGNTDKITIENSSATITKDFYDAVAVIPYGTEFYSVQEVAQFLNSYGKYLESQGVLFDQIENGIPVNWSQMIAEFLYWSQMGWEVGSITTINPAANVLAIDKDSNIVQPLTFRQLNFVLNQNLYPIQSSDLSIVRDGTAFTATPLNVGDTIAYSQFNISNIEHGIVFDNTTLFNDVIYNLITGLRQNRITVRGSKTAEWNGTINAAGFILNQDNVVEWTKEVKYTKGAIVKYKNKYWTALTIVQAKELFDERDWKQTDYDQIQKGLLPNSSTRSYESTLYYDVNQANLENDADLLSFSLIGYRPRDYMALADLTDITQVNVYKNLIKEKGTLNAASAFKGANLPQGGINYDLYENWAIKSGEFGGLLNNNFIEFQLKESVLTGNPSIVGLTDGVYTDGVQQEVPLYSITNYGRPITSPNVLPTISPTSPTTLLPSAGYVNFNDVKMASYFYSGLSTARDSNGTLIPLSEFYVRDYVWLANYLSEWKVYTPSSLGSIVNAKNNLNGTVTVTFSQPHNLTKYQIFAITNFNVAVDNYYLVAAVVDTFNVIINLSLNPNTLNITGLGIGFSMQNQRVATAPEIINLPLLDNEFNKVKVWVDTNNDGSWAVFRKSINYTNQAEILQQNSQKFGSAVAYTTPMGYLIGDQAAGAVYRYTYDDKTNSYVTVQTITHGASFGSTITYVDDLFVISEPTTASNVYVYQLINTTLVDTVSLYQTIAAPGGVTNWGSATALSGDQNWLYISDTDNNLVYVYRKSAVTSLYVNVGTITTSGLTSGDNFGYSLTTDHYGDTVVIGTPDQNYSATIDNYGYTYVFNRTVQNFEAPYSSQPYIPIPFQLAWTPTTVTQIATATAAATDRITVTSSAGFSVDDPVVFSGTILSAGAISANTVYYVKAKPTGTTFTISATRGGSTIDLAADSGSMTCTVQTSPLAVSINGTAIADTDYAVIGSLLYMYSGATGLLNAGDLINVSGLDFILTQTLTNEQTPRVGVQFGTSVDTNTFANEILVGAPFELSAQNNEGAVHRFTNGGESYGIIVGTADCNITTPRGILLNGYYVLLPVGDAATAANFINAAKITNVYASATDGKLVISLIDVNLSNPNSKLSLVALATVTYAEMGINVFTLTQTILCPHLSGPTQFGSVVKFNEFGSFVASAPTGTRYAATTFDFTDDELDNDTVFDNNATQWVDSFVNAGAVYMFDYLSTYNESVTAPGKFVYAQNTNSSNLDYGSQPMYGTALDFNENRVTVGTPNFSPTDNANDTNGQVIAYVNATGQQDWSVFRSTAPIVDINGIANIQLFSASTNETLENLDYFDPLQGKILGAVQQNIDVIANTDPAGYNSPGYTQRGLVWGADKLGLIWFNTTNARFMNYHQNDVVYNSQYWGKLFPGSDVAVYSWIASDVIPSQYTGPGLPFNTDNYTVQGVINQQGIVVPVYYFWARNTNIIFDKLGKTLADSTLQSYIAQPQASGISYFAALQPNVFALYNSAEFVNANDTTLHIGFATGTNDDVAHNQFSLIRANYADDFLPGLPGSGAAFQAAGSTGIDQPIGLYNRMLDSMCGVDGSGAVVPNPLLPKLVQSGVLARPRQSFFFNRFGALKNYLQYANTILSQFPITETRNAAFLSTSGAFYDTSAYWSYINWWATGYNDNTKAAFQVAIYADLSTLDVAVGTIVSVASNGSGNAETYVLAKSGWVRIGLTNGTIAFSSKLWDYSAARLGFGDNFFDTTVYDEYPSEETRYIVRALNEEIYTNELQIFRNKSLILLFEYIQSETVENQNYLPWLNKTSLMDVSHTIRELLPLEVFRSDNQDFLAGYINEAKPYHVVIKEFLFKYTGTDVFEGDITDFDLPAQYNTSIQQFITPELVYANPNGDDQFLPTDTIWNNSAYSQWFNNYGLSIVGQDNYPITILASYISLTSNSMYVDNASGFPVTGTVLIGTEYIGYTSVDLVLNQLNGLARGTNGTEIQAHIPGEKILIDLPAVLVLNSGRGYTEPPKVTAYIDTSIYPAPRVAAQLEPIMSLDTVIGVKVLNPGEGYAVLPTINFDPAFVITASSDQVSVSNNTIEITVPLFQTGDLIIYNPAAGSTTIGGLIAGARYYVGVLESSPTTIIALYSDVADLLNDHDRILLTSTGTGTQTFSVSATASCVTSSTPVRENNISLKFDRTSYTSQVQMWEPAGYYGSFYAGSYNDSDAVSSSSIKLQSTQPPIDTILASAHGVPFEILAVENQQTLTWSSRTRDTVQTYGPVTAYPNAIRINPTLGGSPVEGELGSTIGFYIGMPVKFVGAATGNLVDGTTYYVKTLVKLPNIDVTSPNYGNLEDTGFTISATADADGNPGAVFVLSTATVPAAGLVQYVGELTNVALLTLNYDGIRTATATIVTTNIITVPLVASGQSGTTGFYAGLPIFFTGNVLGGILENEIYYVTTVIDLESFTMSTSNTPTIIAVTDTSASGYKVTCESTISLSLNEPIIFTGTTFGNIVAGTTYYVREIFSGNTTFSISTTINGAAVVLTTDSGTCSLTSQKNTVALTSATGSMTLNVGIPVSPGQITGQEFTLYETSGEYVNVSGTVSNLLEREITATLATVNRICVSNFSGGITNAYTNMQFTVANDIGGLTTLGGPYTVTGTGTTTITVTATTAGNHLVCANTNVLYEGMPLQFSGTSLGQVSLGVTYYVLSIINGTDFTIAEIVGGTEYDTNSDSGLMYGTGESYLIVATSLSDAAGPVLLTQVVNATPVFDVNYALGGYGFVVATAGSGYAVNNIITILGTSLDGTTPTNDLTLQVLTIDSNGGVVTAIASGTPNGNESQYYFEVYSVNQVKVYSNSNLTSAVSGQNFPFNGVTSTSATATVSSNDRVTVTSSADFALNDPVVFTGTVFGNIVLGNTYYIKSKPTSTTVTLSETIGGSTFQLGDQSGTMTMAKIGDYAFLPEPFFFSSSIVKYNKQLYQCIISNNDAEFILGKWELLIPGDNKLNALDRIIGYYEPTVNMPGVDLTQLVEGIVYPNGTYLGNAFAPADEFELDTILTDQTFYPTGINLKAIVWNGTAYLAGADSTDYSAITVSIDGNDWAINKLASKDISITDLIFAGGKYVITSNNNATPILISDDGYNWITNGLFTPYASTGFDDTTYDISSLSVPAMSLNSVTYSNGIYVAVGNNVITSIDLYSWTESYAFPDNGLTNVFTGVTYASTAGFTGFVAVGSGQRYVSGQVVNVGIIYTSTNGYNWYPVNFTDTVYGFTSVTSNGQTIVAVGENSIIYTSFNAITWFAQSSTGSATLNNIIWNNYASLFIAVGANGSVKTAPIDGGTWTTQSTGVTVTLESIVWNNTDSEYVVVGLDNTILKSTDLTTWTQTSAFITAPSVYNVQGDEFTAGYGPEEMVPGVVSDTITMTIVTRPGTNWDATIYQHVGYNVVSAEIAPLTAIQTNYSFADLVQTPAQLNVFVTSYVTGLSTTIYEGISYTVDWINKVVILTTPLTFVAPGTSDTLRIDVYEVGNGDQLVKANTETDPIRLNTSSGFNEIYVNANYSASIYQGSGVIRPTTQPLEAIAIKTNDISDTITCESVENFVLNSPIRFSGAVFGNIVEDQVYYVKSISTISSRIIISEFYNVGTGTAGETFALSNATGMMTAIIQVGTGIVWTPPAVYHNGTKLVLGTTASVIRTKSGINTITTNSTGGLIPNTSIVFSDTMFGGVIVPQQVYYVKTIYDGNEFTISETSGGTDLELTDATGGATFVTSDFAIGLADNGVSASIVFSAKYDNAVDYVTYTLFGETLPVQYGYTIPETQLFAGNGSTASFQLTNYVGGDNPTNAIVEINGIRQNNAAYTISAITNTVLFSSPPAAGTVVAVRSYNLTERQYLNTQYNITGSIGSTLGSITISSTTHSTSSFDQNTPSIATYDENSPVVVLFDQTLNWLTLASGTTSSLIINSSIVFSNVIGGIIAGQTYYITEILNSTDFVISTQVGGLPYEVTTDSGAMTSVVNGLTVANIINVASAITNPITTVIVSGTAGATDYITCSATSGLIVGQDIIFKAPVFAAGTFSIGKQYQIVSLGNTNWNTVAGTIGVTYTVGSVFTAATTGSGTGTALLASLGGISTLGQFYFIRAIISNTEFTIEDQYGNLINLTTDTANVVAYMGGQSAVRVTTGINNNLTENALVRIDGTLGSTQLNNNTYYAKIINETQFDLYLQPYNPALNAVNYPVTAITSYISGGYVWLDELFTIADTTTISTSSAGNRITVVSTSELVANTPVYFTSFGSSLGDDILGNITAKTEYYILEVRPEMLAGSFIVGNEYQIVDLGNTDWNVAAGTTGVTYAIDDIFIANAIGSGTGIAAALQEFTITADRFPNEAEVVLADATGAVNVSQFQQTNVDRLWVTINGYRVPSSSLRLNAFNNLSILATIETGSAVIITSMMPTATPNEIVYLLTVSTTNQAAVYRANTQTRTWLAKPLYYTDKVIYLNDASSVTDAIEQNAITPAAVDNKFNIGLISNKDVICHVTVFNNTTQVTVNPINYKIVVVDLAPILQISAQVAEGDALTITTLEGRLIYINGEKIGFAECDLVNNTVSQLTRGALGTGEQEFIPLYSEVFGIIPNNRMTDVEYSETWNPIPGIYNTVDGDPPQIANTQGAYFLRVDKT